MCATTLLVSSASRLAHRSPDVGRSGARSDRWTGHGNIVKLAERPERAGTRERRGEAQGPGEPAVALPPPFGLVIERKRLAAVGKIVLYYCT